MSEPKYFHFTVESSKTEMIASIDEDKIVTVIGYFNGFRNEGSHNYEERKTKGYEKGKLKHHEFSQADVRIPQLERINKDFEKLEPHDLLTIIEYRTKIKEKKEIEHKDVETPIVNENDLGENTTKQSQENIQEALQEGLDSGVSDKSVTEIAEEVKAELVTNENSTEKDIVIEKSDKELPLDTDKFYFFSSQRHCFHPSFPAVFKYRDKQFISVNQFIAYSKASLAKDDETAFKLLDLNNSDIIAVNLIKGDTSGIDIIKSKDMHQKWKDLDHKINELNRNINGLSEMYWEEKRMGVMTVATREKCLQNDYILDVLKKAQDKKIIFAIQDPILGCGIKEKELTQDSTWTGVNELGKLLNEIEVKNAESI